MRTAPPLPQPASGTAITNTTIDVANARTTGRLGTPGVMAHRTHRARSLARGWLTEYVLNVGAAAEHDMPAFYEALIRFRG